MPLQTACTSCSAKIKVKDELVGKSIKCPKCGKVFKAVAAGDDKSAVHAGAPAKSAPKSPPAPWDKDDDEKAAPWDKKSKSKKADGKKKSSKKSKSDDDNDDDDAPNGKSKIKPPKHRKKDEEDEDDDDRSDKAFNEQLAESSLPDSTKKMIKNELGLRETGVWVGQPCPKIMTVRALPKAIGAVVFVTIFGIGISVVLGMQNKDYGVFIIAGLSLLVLLVAAVILIVIPFMDRRKALATAYVITNKRCIVFSGAWFGGPSQESFYPDLLAHMRRMASWIFKDNAGDIVFRSVTIITTTHSKRGTSTSSSTTYYGFLGIRNIDEIEHIIRQTLLSDDDDDDDDDD